MVAKKADNTDGFELIYKSVNDIQANEFHVATSIDGRQSQEFLEQTKKHLDKKAVKNQVDKLAKAKNVAKVFNTAQELVDDIAANRSTIRKNIIELAESKAYAKKYFDKFIKQGDFDDWFKNTFAKYEGNTLNFEAHHIIPIDVLKTNPDLKQLLFDLKKADPNFNFDFNGIDNGMMIQKKNLKLDINGHTIHNDYNREISKKISEIITLPRNVNKPQRAFDEIKELIQETKDKLEKEVLLGTKNVNDIINF
ncbi:AHH domain-containing protein [Capnocytophaga canimorsus]|uniref:AHH domain-containing protein n=1 Tax=Capnocytophaga canimorsus TaxID=28188 RepID=UPI0037D7066E